MRSFKNYSRKSVLIFLIMIFTLALNLGAQEEKDLLNTKISIDAEDGSVSHIISTMAKLSGCNIVLAIESDKEDRDGSEERKLTIHLKDVPIEQALSLVVKSIGLSYRLIGDKTFIVGEKERIEEEIGERTYVIYLNYVDVTKLAEALEIMPAIFSIQKFDCRKLCRKSVNVVPGQAEKVYTEIVLGLLRSFNDNHGHIIFLLLVLAKSFYRFKSIIQY